MSCVEGMRRVYRRRKERCRVLCGNLWSMMVELFRFGLYLCDDGVVFLPIKLKLSYTLSFLVHVLSFNLFPLIFFLNSNIISEKRVIQPILFLNR
jgi:hypothetical protein